MHVHNASLFDTEGPEQIIRRLVPDEFAFITYLWTYNDTQAAYPLVGDYEYVSPLF